MPATCGEEAKLEREKLAIKLALKAPDGECVLFRRQPRLCPPPPPPPVTTSSGWYALGFAGAPYLQDSRASLWSKIVPSVLDAALLIGAGVSFGLAVDYRNQHAAGQASLRPATRALNLGIGFAIGWGATRVVSGVGYETTSFWQEQRQ